MSYYRGMTCENVSLKGDGGTPITAYVAKPSGQGPFPGVVLVHHLPGWSEFYIETTRRFAHHGYIAICANLYERAIQARPNDAGLRVSEARDLLFGGATPQAEAALTNAFSLLRLLPMSDRDKDAETLALRHQITILQRQLGTEKAKFAPKDRAFLGGRAVIVARGELVAE